MRNYGVLKDEFCVTILVKPLISAMVSYMLHCLKLIDYIPGYEYVEYGEYYRPFYSGYGAYSYALKKPYYLRLPEVDDYYDYDEDSSVLIDVKYDDLGLPHYELDEEYLGQNRLVPGPNLGDIIIFNMLFRSKYNASSLPVFWF